MRTTPSARGRSWGLAGLLAVACTAVSSSAAQAQTCGLPTNAGFESDLTGWTASGPATIVADVHSGTKAVRIGAAQGGINGSGLIPVTPGQQLTFQTWAKVSAAPSWAGVGLDFLNAAGTEVGEINLQITATAYTLRSVTQAVPAGATRARIWTWKSGGSGNLFLDDFCVSVPTPADTQAPTIPTGLVSSAVTQTGFTLGWAASTDNVGVTGYEVFRNGASIGTSTATSLPVAGLTAGTTHAMRVRARDAAGNWSAQSAALNVTTSPAPVTSCGAITNNGFESGLTGWNNDGGTALTTDAHSGASAVLTGPAQGGVHYLSTVPAVAGQTVAFSAWGKVSAAPSWAGVGYDYLDAAGTELGEQVFTVTGTAYAQYSVTEAAPAGTARISIWSWKSGTSGNLFLDDFCLTVSGTGAGDTQAPSVPTGLAASNVSSSSFTLSWTPSTDNVAVTGYEVFRDGGSIGTTATTATGLTGLAASSTYSMTVRARDAAGNWSAQSAALGVTTTGGSATFDITVDKNVRNQTIDGFGFFGAQNSWWSSASSLWSDAWGDQVISDLGITIWRNEYYPPGDQFGGQDADWNKQRPVVRGLKAKADQYGVDLKFIFTVWSPPSSMKVAVVNNVRQIGTPHPFGTKQGGALDPTQYAAFADWLGDGIELYRSEGIEPYAISPQNEPFFVQAFNSCWYKQEWYPEMLIGAVSQVRASHPDVKIFGSEGMLEMEAADNNWQWFYHKQILDSAQARQNVDILAVHGYSDGVAPTSGSILGGLWASHKRHFGDPMGKPQWMTETSGYVDSWNGSPGAFSLGLDIMSGLNNGNMSGWVWWQGSENPGSTAGVGEFALMNGLNKGKKYYVSKQFYRYIRPGAVRIAATSTNGNVFASAYQHAGQGTHTIVLANTSTNAQTVTLGGAGLPASFTIIRTSATENALEVGTYATGTGLSLPGRSIVTLQAGGTPLATMAAAVPEEDALEAQP